MHIAIIRFASLIMIRLGGMGGPPPDPKKEAELANAAVIGNAVTFAAICLAIHVSPFFLEQLGFEVLL